MVEALPDILYRDERIIVLDKPTGLLSVPGIGPEKADCLAARVSAAFPGARNVHRLDRDTSGVIVMAFDAEAHRQISIQFQDRLVGKRYAAVVAGVVGDDEGVIDLPLRKDFDHPPRQMVDHEHGRPSVTRWRVETRDRDRSRLELTPITGRSHQLRLHLLAIGHPILGDDLYAPPDVRAMSDRLLLHATMLTIIHPSTAARMTFSASCPF
jgi:tRNA pseudouridine32 synthase/23S rRNA pseudouridine746 synthase